MGYTCATVVGLKEDVMTKKSKTKNPKPIVGQLWKDKDPRRGGRTVRIIEVTSRHVTVQAIYTSEGSTGRKTKIMYDNFFSDSLNRGYVLASVAEPEPATVHPPVSPDAPGTPAFPSQKNMPTADQDPDPNAVK